MRCKAVIDRKVAQNDRLLRPAMAGFDPKETYKFLQSGHSRSYSITLAACTRIELGILMLSALAVFMNRYRHTIPR